MFIRAFGIEPEPWADEPSHWHDAYFEFAEKMDWPVKGYLNSDAANQIVDRQYVADLVTAADGKHYHVIPWGTYGKDATTRYVLTKGYSSGVTSATVEGYQAEKPLTRAEAVAFIKNLQDKGMTELKAMPEEESLAIDIVNEKTRKVALAAREFMSKNKAFDKVHLVVPDDNQMYIELKERGDEYDALKMTALIFHDL